MEYKFGENKNYEDFASGRVLYNGQGTTNFPVRLAAEIFGRCLSYQKNVKKVTVYDPCCGGGYLLTILGFLYNDQIDHIVGSDINKEAIKIADKNLSLLSECGLKKRNAELSELYKEYHKESHAMALESIKLFETMLPKEKIEVTLLENDILNQVPKVANPDIIITDVPYGDIVEWGSEGDSNMDVMLDSLYDICSETTVVAVCSNKQQKITNTKFQRLEKQNIGKRKFEIFRKQ